MTNGIPSQPCHLLAVGFEQGSKCLQPSVSSRKMDIIKCLPPCVAEIITYDTVGVRMPLFVRGQLKLHMKNIYCLMELGSLDGFRYCWIQVLSVIRNLSLISAFLGSHIILRYTISQGGGTDNLQ